MDTEELLAEVKRQGYKTLGEFVRANVHYLPEGQQKLFHLVCEENAGARSPRHPEDSCHSSSE